MTASATDDLPVAESRAVIEHHARSFSLAARFLPSHVADNAAVLYAFCRLVDDTADEAPDLHTATQGLSALRAELEHRSPPRPIIAAVHTLVERHGFPIQAAHDLVAGVESDLNTVRIPDDARFVLYCYQVAGTVGLMMCGVLGVRSRQAWPHALSLGIGMQITNICRDVLEDARRDRVYLPAKRLAAVGICAEDLLNETVDRQRLSTAIRQLLTLADEHYEHAAQGMHHIPWRARLGILIASRVYRGIGVRLLRNHNADPMHGRTATTLPEKMWWVFRGVLDFLHPRTLGLLGSTSKHPDTLKFVPILSEDDLHLDGGADHHVKAITG